MLRVLFVGIGANLASSYHRTPLDTCRWAISRVVTISGAELRNISPWYRTAPLPVSEQPDFVNAVLAVAADDEPRQFLERLHQVEHEAGRVRSDVNAARVLDLDLLAADDLMVAEPDLVLPHPRLAERAFVLYPLCDIAPEWRHPVLGRTALALRDALPSQRIERLAETTEDLLWRARTLT